jgi:hypothetical protein
MPRHLNSFDNGSMDHIPEADQPVMDAWTLPERRRFHIPLQG